MLELTRLVDDRFSTKKLSFADLRSFAEDHLDRLTQRNPGGVYNQLITDTQAVYNQYNTTMLQLATKAAQVEGLTVTVDQAQAAVLQRLAKQRDLLDYLFGQGSATYQQFFPEGLTAFRTARRDDLITQLQPYRSALPTHLAASHPAEVTEMETLITAFENGRTAQRQAMGEEDQLRTQRRKHRKALTLQLTRSMLLLAADHLENPDRFDDYYNPTYLPNT